MDDMYKIASEFMSMAEQAGTIEEVMSNDARINIGVDPQNKNILLTLDDRYIEMDELFAEYFAVSLWAATETLKALKAKEMN